MMGVVRIGFEDVLQRGGCPGTSYNTLCQGLRDAHSPRSEEGEGGRVIMVLPQVVSVQLLIHALGEGVASCLDLPLLRLDHLQDDGVLREHAEDVEDAHDDPGLDSGEALGLGRVGRYGVEDVDQHKEEGDEQCHPTWKKMKAEMQLPERA